MYKIKIIIFFERLYKKNNRNMSFIKFKNIAESFNAMELHTQLVCGRLKT